MCRSAFRSGGWEAGKWSLVSGMSGVSSHFTPSHIKLNQIEHPSPPAHCKSHQGPHWEVIMCGCACSTLIPHAAWCLTSSTANYFILSIFHCLLTSPSFSQCLAVFQLKQHLLVLLNQLRCQTKQHAVQRCHQVHPNSLFKAEVPRFSKTFTFKVDKTIDFF